MKRTLLTVLIAAMSLGTVWTDADAARLGGGRSSGMKRQAPPAQPAHTTPPSGQTAPQQAQTPPTPAQNAAPTAQPGAPMAAPAGATAAAAAAAPKRNWMGPVAGLAAGLGLAALFSHFGLGGALANIVTMILLALVAVVVVRLLMRWLGQRRSPGLQPAFGGASAGAGVGGTDWRSPSTGTAETPPVMRREALPSAGEPATLGTGAAAPVGETAMPTADRPDTPLSGAPASLPAGFDAPGFERIAKLLFLRLQAANDAGDLADLRRYTTPEMAAEFQLDIQQRAGASQHTDVMQFEAQVVDVADDAGQRVVSVRFAGLIREAREGAAAPFDEVWHFVQPAGGGDWRIAGIAQAQSA